MTTQTHNPNCDGSHCASTTGEVRLYPLGGGAHAIYCSNCFAHENAYRYERRQADGGPDREMKWPHVRWRDAKVYDGS